MDTFILYTLKMRGLGLTIYTSMSQYAQAKNKNRHRCAKEFEAYHGQRNKIVAINRRNKLGIDKVVGFMDTEELRDFLQICDDLTE